MSMNHVIGKNNDLPWHLPDDFKFFQEITRGHHVLMGRKNYESLPIKYRPLPNRINLVLTNNKNYNAPNSFQFVSFEDALEFAKKEGEKELFVIGGGEIYQLLLPLANRIYLTEIHTQLSGDAYFPIFDTTIFKETSRSHHSADTHHKYAFDFVTYDRI